MEHVYPAIFHANKNGSYTIVFPDLPGCISEGKSLPNAMEWAHSALSEWLQYLIDKKEAIPPASSIGEIKTESDAEFVTLIYVANLTVKKAASAMGRKGGAVKSDRKTVAVRENGKMGGETAQSYARHLAEQAPIRYGLGGPSLVWDLGCNPNR
ncbi:MAG: type II toxin-antitoxin system HicB family antitoxin [Treponema sp.]|nr:type II toxin-antitoxin system HicB family antitoxin [Treponema sp.]